MTTMPLASAEELLEALRGGSSGSVADELSATAAAQPRGPVPVALVAAAARAPEVVARVLLSRAQLRHWTPLLTLVVASSDAGTRAYLHRHVFPDLHGRGPEFDALYHAVTRTSPAERHAWLTRVGAAGGDSAALAALVDEVRPVPPSGHDVVSWHVGSGKTSRVALLRRATDGARIAWKLPANDGPAPRRDLALQVERSRDWVRLGVSTAAAEWAPDGRTLLQPFVDGPSLHALIQSEPGLLRDAADARTRALSALLARLAAASTFVSGLNAANLIFDGAGFQVIDSGDVRRERSARLAWYRTRLACQRKWTRGADARRAPAVRSFLEATEAALPQEHRLSLWLRLASVVRLALRPD